MSFRESDPSYLSVGRGRRFPTRRLRQFFGKSSCELEEQGLTETRVLISTDVLSEGLNLQDATRVINYDIHWNPVRLMQCVGRVDRRMNRETEAAILAEDGHPLS